MFRPRHRRDLALLHALKPLIRERLHFFHNYVRIVFTHTPAHLREGRQWYAIDMNYNIKGTELAITTELRGYVEKCLSQADKFLQSDSSAHTDVELQYSSMRDGGKYRAEFTVSAAGALYRKEEWGTTMHEAIDLASAGLIKELRQHKKKKMHFVRRGAGKVKDIIRGFRS